MAHRTHRLALSLDDAPEVRRSVDFDGRHTLQDVHEIIQQQLIYDDGDWHAFAFYLSGKYFDRESEYGESPEDGKLAHKARLFRLSLSVGQRFVYLFNFKHEQRIEIQVVAITDTTSALAEPIVVESVGELPSPEDDEAWEEDDEEEDEVDLGPIIAGLVPPARALIEAHSKFEDILHRDEPDEDREPARALAIECADAALNLSVGLVQNYELFLQLARKVGDGALTRALVALPLDLSFCREFDRGLAIAEAYSFLAPERMSEDSAVILASAGRREEALARVAKNLETTDDPYYAEMKAGDAYRALPEMDSAEAYYRHALNLATNQAERSEVALRIASLYVDTGREVEADAFLRAEYERRLSKQSASKPAAVPSAGRNEPCPCGSGKKYKKCHGASA